jgi:hypothetical protein
MTKRADFTRRVRARFAKAGESPVAEPPAASESLAGDRLRAALHVTNGDSTAVTLEETGLAPRLVVWRDVLHEGPVPAVGDSELREVRARFLGGPDAETVRRTLAERDRALADGRDGEYVL